MENKEAYPVPHFSQPTSKGVQCLICPHHCNLSEGQYGLCHSRYNQGGILRSQAYGRLCALCLDPIEKKPLLHYHPGWECLSVASTGCNFACLNCQNADISQAKPSQQKGIEMSPEDIADECTLSHSPAIAYTYTEPLTFYEYTYNTARIAHERGIKNILVSAGFINDAPLRQLCPLIDAANIDLKSFSDELYVRINRGHLEPVLHTLKTLKEYGVWLEITNLLIPTVNDSENMISEMCHWLVENGFENNPLHFSRFFPMYRMKDISPTPLKTLLIARDIALQEGMKFVYLGNVHEMEGENTYCPSCHRLLVRRDGFNVLENHIQNGLCKDCHSPIPGVW